MLGLNTSLTTRKEQDFIYLFICLLVLFSPVWVYVSPSPLPDAFNLSRTEPWL